MSKTKLNTAAYGCRLRVKSKTDITPSEREHRFLAFFRVVDRQDESTSVMIPRAIVAITVPRKNNLR